jgi:anti-sigma regulatory factor (Ser/Thr protein kinase)
MIEKFRLTKSAELSSLAAFRAFIDQICAAHSIDEQMGYDLKLAVDEAATNVIQHGYAGMNPGSLILDVEWQPAQIVLRLTDFGHPFEPYEPAPPDVQAELAGGANATFGLFIIYKTMDAVDYQTTDAGNTLILTKRFAPTPV